MNGKEKNGGCFLFWGDILGQTNSFGDLLTFKKAVVISKKKKKFRVECSVLASFYIQVVKIVKMISVEQELGPPPRGSHSS